MLTIETPANALDWWFVKQHANSEWGQCLDCFHTKEDWKTIFNKIGFKIIKTIDISPWKCFFADHPLIYITNHTAFILES